jgi:Txe/YoeB family toxin of Txe-Axe toxin-antitoxin module
LPKHAIILQPETLEDLEHRVQTDRNVALRVLGLIDSARARRSTGRVSPNR